MTAPSSLTIEEAFRAAYFMIRQYREIEEPNPSDEIVLLEQYMTTDPARSDDWARAVDRALAEPSAVSLDDSY